MRFVEIWISTPLARGLGWTLLHSLWQGAVIAAGLVVAIAALRSAQARYAAAVGALILMLGAVGLTLFCIMPEGAQALRGSGPPTVVPWKVRADIDAMAASGSRFSALAPWLATFWILGVWIFALRQVAGFTWVCRLRRHGVCCAPERWQKELSRLGARLRLSRPILLLESCMAEVPAVVGHLRPVILLPMGLLAGLPPGQVEAILLHALAHIRRNDYLVNVVQRSVESLLFYHPAVWWISSVIRTERENCCDDMVVATRGNVREYAEALAALEQNRWSGREPVVAASGGILVKRIRRMLDPQGANNSLASLFAVIILVAAALVALSVWPAKPRAQNAPTPAQQAGHPQPSPYEKWLTQEVAYIIDAKERAAFVKLKTNEERDEFIKEFWERRNPHPGSPENTFKVEFYRRIAYANEHYASAARAGWQTDRGHMYIIHGPPDEVDSHPAGSPNPYEEWLYRSIPGLGNNVVMKFTDPSRSGDYRLAGAPQPKRQ